MEKKCSLVDVPVRINIWVRPECQRKQFEVLRQARPSILFLQSDGGRNEKEWEAINNNRLLYETSVDWECEIHKIYETQNRGLYTMSQITREYIWERVDRCIFLEDDHIPSVSFFSFCAELLEKYKDDQRIEMITGNNVFTQYPDAEPYDYFFSEIGWSIWGIATWRNRAEQREYPLKYRDNDYIKKCMKDNMSVFWFNKANGYCNGRLVDGHVPGGEYYHMANSVLYHRLSIIPTKNMISNIGTDGEHAKSNRMSKKRKKGFFELQTFELTESIRHPEYIIDDKNYGKMYSKKLGHSQTKTSLFVNRIQQGFRLLLSGKLIKSVKAKIHNSKIET